MCAALPKDIQGRPSVEQFKGHNKSLRKSSLKSSQISFINSITVLFLSISRFSWRSTLPTWTFNPVCHTVSNWLSEVYIITISYVRPAWAYALLYRAAQSGRRGSSELCGSVEHVGYVYPVTLYADCCLFESQWTLIKINNPSITFSYKMGYVLIDVVR